MTRRFVSSGVSVASLCDDQTNLSAGFVFYASRWTNARALLVVVGGIELRFFASGALDLCLLPCLYQQGQTCHELAPFQGSHPP